MGDLPSVVDGPAAAPTIASVALELTGRELTDGPVEWPADVFALAGVVLRRTHAYRFAVSPPVGRHWPPGGSVAYDAAVGEAGAQWAVWAEAPDGAPPARVADAWATLRAHADVPLEDLASGQQWAACEALLVLHGVGDEACAGIAAALDPVGTPGYRYRARAAELLARTGSLSRLPTHRLRVLPKARTPPGGISFRSLSRHVCVQGPAVDVRWNKAPGRRTGLGQQLTNVLLLPWPLRVRQRDFRPVPGSVRRAENEPFGTFEFAPVEAFDLGLVEDTLRGALDEVERVGAVVLPETSVPVEALGPLETLLGRYGVSLLLAGAREPAPAPGRLAGNWVHIGVRVGETWAHYRQNKHHRWFLDESQINQYHLAGALHPSVRWWEAMEVPRRSVQFLEISAGVTVAAVVCEDLARLDEVAELLRDVGPTLVVTILLDGPQLSSRWTARYASVLADDPGSAVLTLTAHGMVERSRPAGHPPSRVVAMWKDPARGVREIQLDPGAHGVVVSVAASRVRRRVADGRIPLDNATGLVLAGVFPVRAAQDGGRAPAAAPATAAPLAAADLGILTGWVDALSDAVEHRPALAGQLVADARPKAPWRAGLGLPEPAAGLAAALTAVCDAVAATSGTAGPGWEARVLAALDQAVDPDQAGDPDPPVALARAVLRSAVEARGEDRETDSTLA